MKRPALGAWLAEVGAEAAFQSLAALVPEAAVIVVDAREHVVAWSGEAEWLLGWSAAEVEGGPCPGGVACETPEERPFGGRLTLRRRDGVPVKVRHLWRALEGRNGPAGAIHLLVLDGAPTSSEVSSDPLPADAVSFHGLLTRDPAMVAVIQTIKNVAETDATVLVRGESGTGKELVARAIHAESARRQGPFIAVNCAAFSPSLLESELFGHTRGAFTGAVSARKGIFAQADRGTLFLDEVAELSPDLQSRLLRVLQDRTFVPVGGTEPVAVDVRVIAATHRALREEVRAGRFREDLMYRLRVVPIFLPPLRERRGDVELLLHHWISVFNVRGPRRVRTLSPEAMRALLDHRWPGNVRELRNVVEYAFAVGRGPEIGIEELPPEFRETGRPLSPTSALEAALREARGDLGRAAELLGVSRTTLWRMRKRAANR